MVMGIEGQLQQRPVVPLVAPADAATGIRTAQALVDGGLAVIEVVLRTPAAVDCLGDIAAALPDAIVGAGTVLSEQQAAAVLERGARFLVSPGLYEPVVRMAHDAGVPVFPGVATASEAQQAWNLGLRTLKFFPASLAGGTAMIRALGAVFRDVKFMPTGGVSAANLADYLALPNVLACGGSWLTPADAIAAGRYADVTRLAREAVELAAKARR